MTPSAMQSSSLMPGSAVSEPSPLRAFWALTAFLFTRLWRIRQMGWVALGLLTLVTATVAVMTYGPIGWGIANRYSSRHKIVVSEYGTRLDQVQMTAFSPDVLAVEAAVFAAYRGVMADPHFQADWAFLSYSRWVIFAMYLGFVLPLFTLAYASGAIGGEREGGTLIWLLTRPLPRWAVYLATFFGVLPWCLIVNGLGLLLLGLAGGELGHRAVAAYGSTIVLGTVALASLFHLIGALFRRPAVVGLVYIFFFETLVANLPGSLKQLSLNYYIRSLLYNEAMSNVTTAVPETFEVYEPADTTTARLVLVAASLLFTGIGMVLFARQEPAIES